jgi:oxygen-independent coproporphyrinogen-3 oxidase
VALYIHVPFCRSRCAYCDFNTTAGLDHLIPAYVTAVCREIRSAGQQWGRLTAPTIYLGGGTPSLLPPELISRLLRATHGAFDVDAEAEVTLEANPGTLDAASYRRLRKIGVNRLSLGVQSACDEELQLLGRIHTWAQAREAFRAARVAGFDNVSLDFIFGLPGQTMERWQATVKAALELGPEHLSLYGLSVEEKTPLGTQIARGELPQPDDDLAAEMYAWAEQALADEGYFHYEISNWARATPATLAQDPSTLRWWPGSGARNADLKASSETISPSVCRHNLTYWRNEPWLGLGAGAHSWLNGHRWANVRHAQAYIAALDQDASPLADRETIDKRQEMGETMILGLRLAEGVSDARFRARFGAGLLEVYGDELTCLRQQGLLEWDGHRARLTARGRLLGNQAFLCFV